MSLNRASSKRRALLFGGVGGVLSALPQARIAAALTPALPVWGAHDRAGNIAFDIPVSGNAGRREYAVRGAASGDPFPADLLRELFKIDPAAAAMWEETKDYARRLLTLGSWDGQDKKAKTRYTYVVRDWLPRVSMLYAVTREKSLQSMIRALMFDLAGRPESFWVHSELRSYNPFNPVGGLETAELLRSVALALSWAGDVFTPEESGLLRDRFVVLGLTPCLRWLDRPVRSNWLAVVGGAVLIAGSVFSVNKAREAGNRALTSWLALVEADGSYGEPLGYYDYALQHFFAACLFLPSQDRQRLLDGSPLRGALRWYAYHLSFGSARGADRSFSRVNFGDDDLLGLPSLFVLDSLSSCFNDSLGPWLSERFGGELKRVSVFHLIFKVRMLKEGQLLPAVLKVVDLPLFRAFDSGVVFLRTGWTGASDIVLGLRSGGASRTGYVHDRLNRNSLVVLVGGDCLIAAPGRASYRSPLRKEWDLRTSSHSALVVGGRDQRKDPSARLTLLSRFQGGMFLESDASEAYSSVRSVVRRVWLLDGLSAVVIEDHVVLSGADRIDVAYVVPTLQRDFVKTQNGWLIRGSGQGKGLFAFSSRQAGVFSSSGGVVHQRYSYSPGDAGEGRLGSARRLSYSVDAGADEPVHIWTLLLFNVPETESVTIRSLSDAAVRVDVRSNGGDLVRAFHVGRDQNGRAFFDSRQGLN